MRDFQRHFHKLRKEMEVEVVSHGRVVGKWINAKCKTLDEAVAWMEVSEVVKVEDRECDRCKKVKRWRYYEENGVRYVVCDKCWIRSHFKDIFPNGRN